MTPMCTRSDVGPVAVLTLDRVSKLNAYRAEMGDELCAHLASLREDGEMRACVLTGAGGRAFCAGADLGDPLTHSVNSVDAHLADLDHRSAAGVFSALLDFPKPLICAVNGYAIGIGFQMALCCDMIVASSGAQFRLPQATLGIMPAYGGGPRLAQWVGRGRAMEIAMTGRFVGAAEGERIGLVTRVFEPGGLPDGAIEIAASIAQHSELSLALVKESMYSVLEHGALATTSAADNYRFMVLSMTSAATQRHQSWRDREQPGTND